jgi:SAM-dependent methyltransferase
MEPTEENIRAFEERHRREAAPRGLPPAVRERLPSLDGRHVLHLRSGTGEATADLVALGALVTGANPYADEIVVARERVPNALFVHCDLGSLPLELRRARFHLVYSALGALATVRDLDGFAQGVVAALRPGGYALLHDDHPIVNRVDPLLHWRGDYFDGQFRRLDEIVTAIARAGLTIRRLEELPATDVVRRHDPRMPAELVVVGLRAA